MLLESFIGHMPRQKYVARLLYKVAVVFFSLVDLTVQLLDLLDSLDSSLYRHLKVQH